MGYFCVTVPEELILAAGLLPVRLRGDPAGGTGEADKYLAPFYQTDIRSALNLLLEGRYDFVDYLVLPHSRDAVVAIYRCLRYLAQEGPVGLKLPQVYFLDMPRTQHWASSLYFEQRLREFVAKLEQWSGSSLSQHLLEEAVGAVRENRQLLAELNQMRTAHPPRLSGVEALEVIGSAMFVDKRQHSRLLRQLLGEAESLGVVGGVRLFVSGSPLDNLEFYQLVESCGAVVVAEDNCWGNRYLATEVKLSDDPLRSLALSYQRSNLCPTTYPLRRRIDYCLEQALVARAEGVIFYLREWDGAAAWEYPRLKQAFERAGLPTLCLARQKYKLEAADRDALAGELSRFVSSLRA